MADEIQKLSQRLDAIEKDNQAKDLAINSLASAIFGMNPGIKDMIREELDRTAGAASSPHIDKFIGRVKEILKL